MDFTIGMNCPSCKKLNKFSGGQFGKISCNTVNYNCQCGFSAVLIIPNKGYERFKIEFEKESWA